ncbi:MAG: O-succinylbenzoate-CoA synthase [Mycolicibacterium sp.]|uniref:O-succinylbenzoate-CoA synthase n=1 Tax=Mycolicibacterium sp. TaxID=2320850 RepID=UPI003D0FA752
MRTLIDFEDASVFAIPAANGMREGVLIEGPQGWGEFSPPPDCDDVVAARWLTTAMEPGTVGWPDAIRGRVPVVAATECLWVSADQNGWEASGPEALRRAVIEVGDPDVAVTVIQRLTGSATHLELVELVCGAVEIAAAIRRRVQVPTAVDANLLATEKRPSEIADIAVLRCGPLGGVRRALRRAEALELPCLMCLTGITSIGVAADVALAAALPDLPFACSRGAGLPGDDDVVAEARALHGPDGFLPAAPMPAAPAAERLARVRVTDSATIRRWQDLLRRAAAAL